MGISPPATRQPSKQLLSPIGGLSFLLPFVGVGLFARYVAGWDIRQSQIAGIALSTTSLAVVYAVLVETGLTATELGKILMAATFITDLGTALALSVLFVQPTLYLALFIAVSIAVIALMVVLRRPFFARYGARVIEPEIKGVSAGNACSVLTSRAHSNASFRRRDRYVGPGRRRQRGAPLAWGARQRRVAHCAVRLRAC